MTSYQSYKDLFKDQVLPLAFLDQDLLDKNILALKQRAKNTKVRVASKSIRCHKAIEYILNSDTLFEGVMCFTVDEANFLAEKGLDNLLIGYPSMQRKHIQDSVNHYKKGKKIVFMVNNRVHLTLLNEIAVQNNVTFEVCIDMDMSVQFPGVYFGVYRSSITNNTLLQEFLNLASEYENIKVVGLMGYEAQIAGVGDNAKGKAPMNQIIRFLKKTSISKIAKRRGDAVKLVEDYLGYSLRIVNAGGTGSIESSIQESWVNEITIGSGFFSPALFDNYKNFKHEPALAYAMEIDRIPKTGMYTCHGGGYVASGSVGQDKQPVPYLPKGVQLITNEGTGEVQTPFKYAGNDTLEIGDPVFFRHAKAGELCERFNNLQVVSKGKIINQYPTYRGEGNSFL